MKKEYIVGIDFGYDVTSAWVISLFDDNLYGEPLKLKATNRESERSYYSVIYSKPNGSYSLDDLQGNIIAGFKDKVSVLNLPQNIKKREAYIEYIKQIYIRLLKHNTVLKVDNNGDTNFYLCIACPTKWNQEDKDAYIKFFNNALREFGIEVMWVINESDAIFIQAVNKNALIINYNAGYIEYFVINNGSKKYLGSRLGSDFVVEILLDECRKDVDFQETFKHTYSKLLELEAIIDVESLIKNEIRKGVEYSVTYGYYPNLVVSYNLIGVQTNYGLTDAFKVEKWKYRFEIDCQIDKYIGSYKEKLENEFNMLIEKTGMNCDNKIDNVIITGHDSCMPWMCEVVKKVFNTSTIHVDQSGYFAIARGIALFAKQQMKAYKTLTHI